MNADPTQLSLNIPSSRRKEAPCQLFLPALCMLVFLFGGSTAILSGAILTFLLKRSMSLTLSHQLSETYLSITLL